VALALVCALGAGGCTTTHRTAHTATTLRPKGELHIGYLPRGFTRVGGAVDPVPGAKFPYVSHYSLYDDLASTGGGTHGAFRQINFNVMVGRTSAGALAFHTAPDAKATRVRGHRAFLTIGIPNPDTGVADNTIVWIESDNEMVFLSTRGLSRSELLRVAEGLARG